MHRHPTGQTGHPGMPRCAHSARIVALGPAVSQLQCRSPLRTPRLPRGPAAHPVHACRTPCARLRPAPARPLTPARLLAPAPSAPAPVPARPARSLAQPTARPAPYRGRPAGRITGPSAVSQRAPSRIVGGDARQACAQPAKLHNTSFFLYCNMISNLLHQKFFFFMINIYIFFH